MFDRSSVLHFFHVVFSPAPKMSEDEQIWYQFAQSLALGPFIMWLSNQIADRLMCHTHDMQNVEQLINDVNAGKGNNLQSRAENFLHRQHIECDPTQTRRITLFRHFIVLRLRHLK